MEKHFIAQPHNESEPKKESVIPPEWKRLGGHKDGKEIVNDFEQVDDTIDAMEQMVYWWQKKIEDLEITFEKEDKIKKQFDDSISSKIVSGNDESAAGGTEEKFEDPEYSIESLPVRMSTLKRLEKKLANIREQIDELSDMIQKRENELAVMRMTLSERKNINNVLFDPHLN